MAVTLYKHDKLYAPLALIRAEYIHVCMWQQEGVTVLILDVNRCIKQIIWLLRMEQGVLHFLKTVGEEKGAFEEKY